MWYFDQPPDAAVLLSRSVAKAGRPILFVAHDADDHGWQFLDGAAPPSEVILVSMREAVDLDPSVLALADLPPGGCARRESLHHPWIRASREIG
jgi:hypothetical protein